MAAIKAISDFFTRSKAKNKVVPVDSHAPASKVSASHTAPKETLKTILGKFDAIIADVNEMANDIKHEPILISSLSESLSQLKTVVEKDRFQSLASKSELAGYVSDLKDKIKAQALTYEDLSQFEKNTAQHLKNRQWRIALGAVVGALIGFVVGLAIGIGITPAAPITAILGAAKGAAIGAAVASGATLGAAIGLWSARASIATCKIDKLEDEKKVKQTLEPKDILRSISSTSIRFLPAYNPSPEPKTQIDTHQKKRGYYTLPNPRT